MTVYFEIILNFKNNDETILLSKVNTRHQDVSSNRNSMNFWETSPHQRRCSSWGSTQSKKEDTHINCESNFIIFKTLFPVLTSLTQNLVKKGPNLYIPHKWNNVVTTMINVLKLRNSSIRKKKRLNQSYHSS